MRANNWSTVTDLLPPMSSLDITNYSPHGPVTCCRQQCESNLNIDIFSCDKLKIDFLDSCQKVLLSLNEWED